MFIPIWEKPNFWRLQLPSQSLVEVKTKMFLKRNFLGRVEPGLLDAHLFVDTDSCWEEIKVPASGRYAFLFEIEILY